jgi:hypothetical protein
MYLPPMILAVQHLIERLVPEAKPEEIRTILLLEAHHLKTLLDNPVENIPGDVRKYAEFLIGEVEGNDELVDINRGYELMMPDEAVQLRQSFVELLNQYRDGSLSSYGNPEDIL